MTFDHDTQDNHLETENAEEQTLTAAQLMENLLNNSSRQVSIYSKSLPNNIWQQTELVDTLKKYLLAHKTHTIEIIQFDAPLSQGGPLVELSKRLSSRFSIWQLDQEAFNKLDLKEDYSFSNRTNSLVWLKHPVLRLDDAAYNQKLQDLHKELKRLSKPSNETRSICL